MTFEQIQAAKNDLSYDQIMALLEEREHEIFAEQTRLFYQAVSVERDIALFNLDCEHDAMLNFVREFKEEHDRLQREGRNMFWVIIVIFFLLVFLFSCVLDPGYHDNF